LRRDAQTCTLGFPVRREGRQPFNYGFLILGSCLSTDTINNRNGVFNSGGGRVGYADTSDLVYDWRRGLNFAVVKLLTDVNGRSRV
jgi:hypothetical protein